MSSVVTLKEMHFRKILNMRKRLSKQGCISKKYYVEENRLLSAIQ